jgi:DNA-binding XRE family transcriptional regulator
MRKPQGQCPQRGEEIMNMHITALTEPREPFTAAAAAAVDPTLALHALRKRRAMSQEQLAAKLAVGRPAVCKLERRADMHVSNLRRYIEALGGRLEITARFPDGAVTIAEVGEPPP